jgi:hypothetical protein
LVELLWGEAYGLVVVGGALQDREEGLDLRERNHLMPSAGTESIATPAAP